MRRTRVKICGLTNYDDAMAAVKAGADALGFVFAESPRRVDTGTVAEITRKMPPLVSTVGVFSNAPLAALHKIMADGRLMVAQLHGEESVEYIRAVSYPVIKRLQLGADEEYFDVLERIQSFGVLDVLFDPGGGSGVRMDLSMIPIEPGQGRRVYVAGGLTPANVGDAILQVLPFAVDVSSGVESSPGRKNAAMMQDFVAAVRRADRQINGE